ncbi:AF4/FMR2 family member lilli-like [Artemia franciscana]|uniref:AF4/FMR2 family member lilli-like n=1 Tax=Artemia franciscana TaxID=6661 RepID=UPI0032DB6656
MAAPVPLSTYSALLRHHHNVGFLQTSFDLWDQADEMVFRTHSEDFFIQLEHQFGSLTLHCNLRKLVLIVCTAIKKIEKDRKDCSTNGQIHFKTAIQLTALADKESDIVQQFIFYLKAAMHFVVAGLFIDHPGTPCSKEAQSSYKEARKLIKWISKKFENQECSQSQGKYLSMLLVLSMKAQAMLDLNLYKSKDSEVKKDVITLNGHFATSSQMAAPVPLSTYSALLRHHHNVGFLQTSFDLWDQADEMVFRTHSEDFFIQLEHQFGSLTLHCSLRKLVLIVSTAIKKIEKDRKGCSTGFDAK